MNKEEKSEQEINQGTEKENANWQVMYRISKNMSNMMTRKIDIRIKGKKRIRRKVE